MVTMTTACRDHRGDEVPVGASAASRPIVAAAAELSAARAVRFRAGAGDPVHKTSNSLVRHRVRCARLGASA